MGVKEYLISRIRKLSPLAFQNPEGDRGIQVLGHRDYIGGRWDEIGSLQFNFLTAQGMKPDSYLLDIACGALRLGVKAIPYLEPEHYLGIEKESGLIAAGFEHELDPQIRAEKQPQIVISDSFEFSKFGRKADFAIAQSLFSHFPPELITFCMKQLHPWLADDGVFFATYFEVEKPRKNASKPHDHGYFAYTRAQLLSFGTDSGFTANYIGNWNHPAGQVIVEYRKA